MFTKETSFSTILLELGFLGFGTLMCVYWLIFRDALFVAGHGSPVYERTRRGLGRELRR